MSEPAKPVVDPNLSQPGESEDDFRNRTGRLTAAQGYPKDHPKHPDNKAKAAKAAAPSKK